MKISSIIISFFKPFALRLLRKDGLLQFHPTDIFCMSFVNLLSALLCIYMDINFLKYYYEGTTIANHPEHTLTNARLYFFHCSVSLRVFVCVNY